MAHKADERNLNLEKAKENGLKKSPNGLGFTKTRGFLNPNSQVTQIADLLEIIPLESPIEQAVILPPEDMKSFLSTTATAIALKNPGDFVTNLMLRKLEEWKWGLVFVLLRCLGQTKGPRNSNFKF